MTLNHLPIHVKKLKFCNFWKLSGSHRFSMLEGGVRYGTTNFENIQKQVLVTQTQKNNLYLFAIILPFNADLAASADVVVVVVAVVSATVVVDDNLVEFSFLLFPLPPPLVPLPLELVLEPLE